jgi:hypothetical protein
VEEPVEVGEAEKVGVGVWIALLDGEFGADCEESSGGGRGRWRRVERLLPACPVKPHGRQGNSLILS